MEKITYFIMHPEFVGFLSYLRIIFVFISSFLLISIIILLFKSSWLKHRYLEEVTEFITYHPFGAKKTFKYWNKIIKRLETDREAEYKLAVIEADGLLDSVLERMGYKGDSFAKRLEQLSPSVLPNLEEVWKAHKVRNNIVHDPDYRLTLDEAKGLLAICEKALRDLEMF